jgi:anti-sigma factor RsiW
VILRRSVSCQGLVELASDYLDDALSPRRRRAVDRHLATCANCPTYIAQLRTTVQLLGVLRLSDVPDELLDVLERAWLEEHGGGNR